MLLGFYGDCAEAGLSVPLCHVYSKSAVARDPAGALQGGDRPKLPRPGGPRVLYKGLRAAAGPPSAADL